VGIIEKAENTTKSNYGLRGILFEGGDQVGKGDAALNTARELASLGEDVVLISFPFYATPIGSTIRLVLSGGYEEFKDIPAMKGSIGNLRQVECVMALFALNRLETLSFLSDYQEKSNVIPILDRGPFSHALTIAYNVASGVISEEEIEKVVDTAVFLDHEFAEILGLDNCVIQLRRANSTWSATRGGGEDVYECVEVQDICDDIYSKFAKKIGEGWNDVVTTDGGGWVDREEILKEIVNFAKSRMGLGKPGREGSFKIASLDDVVGAIYSLDSVSKDLLSKLSSALEENNKKAMYDSALNIGREIARNTKSISFDTRTSSVMKSIFDDFPECYGIIEHYMGEKYINQLRKAIMNTRDIANKLLVEVERIYPEAQTELFNWSTAFQFLICIILSAQTTDRQVNKVTGELFEKFPTPLRLSQAREEEVENTLRGINYFNTKSRNIIKTAKIIHEQFNDEPPKSIQELQTLPGVGYKTANVFLNDLYQANQGIAVDTHVARVARMYGLTKESDPTKIAKDLEKLYPKNDWYKVNSSFVLYGRYILKAKKPDMDKVVLKEYLKQAV